MIWRIAALLNVALVVVTICTLAANGGRTTVGGLVEFAVSVLVAAGVFGYAFRKPSLSPIVWRQVACFALIVSIHQLGPQIIAIFQRVGTVSQLVSSISILIVVSIACFTTLNLIGVWLYADWLSGSQAGQKRPRSGIA